MNLCGLVTAVHPDAPPISKSRPLAGLAEADANGLRVGEGSPSPPIRVTSAAGTAVYRIDRWD